MHDLLRGFPPEDELTGWHRRNVAGRAHEVNCHIHSPYSFSAFDELEQAFVMASEEQVRVLGINDFNTTEGYARFYELSLKYRIFPLFNIEFMGLLGEEQKKGVRINDPNNPGRIYFCGKGLDYPVTMGNAARERLSMLREAGHRQVREMTAKLNNYLQSVDGAQELDYEEIKQQYTRGMVRERHIARALRIMIFSRYRLPEERRAFLGRLFGGDEPASPADNEAAIENEIRSRLLKSGGAAFVEESPDAFPGLDEIISMIRDAGGIPCYPVLLDDPQGRVTEFESDPESLCSSLLLRNISCIELIPGRNDIVKLKSFVSFFREKGFVILFGTEHNTPAMEPLRVSARGGVPLDDELRAVNYEGACVVAAHQYLRAQGEEGYPEISGSDPGGPCGSLAGSEDAQGGTTVRRAKAPDASLQAKRTEFAETGKAVIEYFTGGHFTAI